MNLSIWINCTILILKTVLTVIKIWVVIIPYNCAEIKSKQSLCICIKHKTRGSYVQQYYIHVLHAHINRQFDANKTCYPNDIRDFKKSLLISQCYFFFLNWKINCSESTIQFDVNDAIKHSISRPPIFHHILQNVCNFAALLYKSTA